ncbi:unnamed protein product, partial [Ectocarpus sp. 12 AP-2014]
CCSAGVWSFRTHVASVCLHTVSSRRPGEGGAATPFDYTGSAWEKQAGNPRASTCARMTR